MDLGPFKVVYWVFRLVVAVVLFGMSVYKFVLELCEILKERP